MIQPTTYEAYTWQKLLRQPTIKQAIRRGDKQRIKNLFSLLVREQKPDVPDGADGAFEMIANHSIVETIRQTTVSKPVQAMLAAILLEMYIANGYHIPVAMTGTLAQVQQDDDLLSLLLGGRGGTGAGKMHGAGDGIAVSLDEMAALAGVMRNNPHLTQILELAGRMEKLIADLPRDERHTQEMPYGYAYGNHVPDLLPTEFLALADPELSRTFDLGYAEEKLRQVCRAAPAASGQGPLILLIDVSGSMEMHQIGSYLYYVWAFALAYTLGKTAIKAGRPVSIVQWTMRIEFEAHPQTIPELGACLEYHCGGGTHFPAWMERIPQLVTDPTWAKADAIVITDGDDTVDPGSIRRWRERMKALKMQVFGIYLARFLFPGWELGPLAQCCDAVCPVTDGESAEEMVKLSFHQMQQKE